MFIDVDCQDAKAFGGARDYGQILQKLRRSSPRSNQMLKPPPCLGLSSIATAPMTTISLDYGIPVRYKRFSRNAGSSRCFEETTRAVTIPRTTKASWSKTLYSVVETPKRDTSKKVTTVKMQQTLIRKISSKPVKTRSKPRNNSSSQCHMIERRNASLCRRTWGRKDDRRKRFIMNLQAHQAHHQIKPRCRGSGKQHREGEDGCF